GSVPRCRMPFLVQIEQLQEDKRSRSTSARNRTRPQWHPPSRVSSMSASSCSAWHTPTRGCKLTWKDGGDGGGDREIRDRRRYRRHLHRRRLPRRQRGEASRQY